MSEWLGKPYTCQWEKIPGWFGFKSTYDMAIAEAKDGDVFVEIGVAFGRSIAYLANGLLEKGVKCHIYAIDPWVDDWWMPPNNYPLDAPRPTWGGEHAEWARSVGGPFMAFLESMRSYAPRELATINVLRAYSEHAHQLIVARHGASPCKMIMIDGNHNYEACLNDILVWRGRVSKGGIFAGDDYSTDFPGVIRAVDIGVRPWIGSNRTIEIDGTTWRVRL